MSDIIRPVANVVSDGKRLRDAMADEEQRISAREHQLAINAPREHVVAADGVYRDKRVGDNANFDQKVYFFPPEFHALREELENNWREFFITANPLSGTSPAWCMVHDAPQFIGYCNGMTGQAIQLDTGDVAYICKQFLNGFRKLRGVGAIE